MIRGLTLGGVDVSFPSQAGYNYYVFSSNRVRAPTWTQVAGPIPGTGALITVNDTPDSISDFYQIVVIEPAP